MRIMLLLLFAVPCLADELPDMPKPKIEASYSLKRPSEPKFWDSPAKVATVATISLLAVDAGLTCNNLAHGGHENELHTQKCSLAVGELALNKAAFWGAAWLAHKTHHHKLERLFEFAAPVWSVEGISRSIH